MSAQAESSKARADVAAEAAITRETNREVWTRRVKTLAPVWTLLAMWVFFSLASSSFATWININNILSQVSTAGILAVGMTFVLLTAEIDLSIAAVMGLAGEVSVQLYHIHNVPEPIPLIAALLTAALCGAFSGLATTVLRIPSFMSTLAMSLIAEGLLLWTSLGRQYFQGDLSPLTVWIGSARVGGSNGLVAMGGDGGVGQGVMILLCAACLLIGYLVLRYTRFGRYVYMAGANPSAARLAGINTKLIVFSVLTICGFTAGVAGIAAQGRLGTAMPQTQDNFLIEAIAVAVLGGTSLMGGKGGMWQTAVGLLIYGSLTNGLDNVASINTFEKTFITGLVLLGALVVNVVFAGRAERDRT
jgi:ribose transport system permease protein